MSDLDSRSPMEDSKPEVPVNSQGARRTQPVVPFQKLFLQSWSKLFRSRTAILRDCYMEGARAAGIDLSEIESLSELREKVCSVGTPQTLAPEYDRDEFERKMVLGNRIFAGWMVLWTSLMPLGCVLWLIRDRIARVPDLDMVKTLMVLVGSAAAFVVFAFCGLLAQVLLARPFVAFMNWFLGLPRVPRQRDNKGGDHE